MTRPLLRPIVRVIVVAIVAFVGLAAAPGVALAQPPPETIEYCATDALGSVRVVFTPTGQVIGRSDYLPFGDTLEQSGMLPRQRFTGQERDGVAGLDDFNARSLQMRTGRMSRPDPLFGNAPVNPQRWNAYSYVTNNPLGFVDPSGMDMVDLPVFKVTIAGYPCSLTNCVTVTGQLGNRLLLDEFRVGGFFWGMGGDLPGPGSTEWPEPDGPGGGGDQGQPPEGKKPPTGDAPSDGFLSQLKEAYCSAVPSGRSISLSGALGGIGAVTGEADQVLNYNSGQTSLFAAGGMTFGWNGGASATASTGLVYGLDGTNNGFSGPFKGASFYAPTPVPFVGAGGSVMSGGGVTVVSVGASAALAGRYGGGISATNTSKPLNTGRFTGFTLGDYLGYLARRPCK